MAPRKAALCVACACLWGCDFLSVRPFDAKPDRLRPETDLFTNSTVRDFRWVEFLAGPDPDSPLVLRDLALRVEDRGDTVTASGVRRRVLFQTGDGSPAPVAAAATLGFDPLRLAPDAALPDPGPSLPLPVYPQPGWRAETVSGDLRFIREFRGVEILDRPGSLVETYAFAESTYWDDAPVASARIWFGKYGLVRHVSEWPAFGADSQGSVLRREISLP